MAIFLYNYEKGYFFNDDKTKNAKQLVMSFLVLRSLHLS